MSPAARASAPLAAIIACLLLPATALAETFTVDPADANGSCGGADKVCPTVQSAVDAAAGGDTISIRKGTYPEAVQVTKPLTLAGSAMGEVRITGSGGADVLRIAADDVTVSSLTIEVPAGGASAVEVASGADGAVLRRVTAQRTAASTSADGVVDVAGTARLVEAFVVAGSGAAGSPGVGSSGAGGTRIEDTAVLSSVGPAAVFSASQANEILRSTLVTTEAASDGVRVLSAAAGARKLLADSSYLLGGANAAGVLARSTGSTAGDIALDLRHVTTTGSAKGVVLDATGAGAPILGPSAGNISATVANSIVHGTSSADKHDGGLVPPTVANSATLTFTTSDIGPTAGDGEIARQNTSTTEDAALFAKNLRLRADSPAVDKGAAGVSGSDRDVEGEPRANGGGPDLGADEFVNKPPTAAFGITDAKPREGRPVGFVSGSTDPEQDAGGGIVEWRWDFGDGIKETTRVGGVAHTYAKTGTYQVTLQVVDRQGAASAVSAPQTVTVRDGKEPEVAITAPAEGQRLRLTRRVRPGSRRTRSLPLTILGTVADASGVESVEVALVQTKRDKVRRKRRKRARRSQSAPQCWHYSGRVFAKKACDNEIWLKPAIRGTAWALQTRSGLRLRPGRWEVRVRATDATGLMSGGFSTADKTLVRFRIR